MSATLYVECGRPKLWATVLVHQFLSHNLETFTHWKETAWLLGELLNLFICHDQKFIHCDLHETLTMWADSETMKCFPNTCWLLLLLTVKIAMRVPNFYLMREIVSRGLLFVTVAIVCDIDCLWHWLFMTLIVCDMADEVSEVRLVGEIDDEVCEIGEANEWRVGWGLWSLSSWWVMPDELYKVSKVGESILIILIYIQIKGYYFFFFYETIINN